MATLIPATRAFNNFYRKSHLQQGYNHKSKSNPTIQARARKRKLDRANICSSKKAKLAYGPDALDVTPDVSLAELEKAKDLFIAANLQLSQDAIQSMCQNTSDQSTCGLWCKEHRKHLTSSLSGDIMCRKLTTPVAPLVKRILYPSFKGNIYTSHGLAMETVATEAYEQWQAERGQHVKVHKCGLVIDSEHQQLGASPDGIVENVQTKEKGLIELKNLLKDKKVTFREAALKARFCLEIEKKCNKL